ncbi:MAG: radical SAM protein [Ignavibacteria bacterium]
MSFEPSYIKLLKSGELKKRAKTADKILSACNCCPHNCLVDRNYKPGSCLSGYLPVVSSYTPHFGEEPVLSGSNGAGNIFFGGCNLRCVYCQNFEISQNRESERQYEISIQELARIMTELQNKGCHNIGLVSPTHFSAQIIKAVYLVARTGLNIPIIYNTNGYDSVNMLRLLDGIIDIYLPDFKYGDSLNARQYSKIPDYFHFASDAIKEMHRQVGSVLVYEGDTVVRGLIIRHLVLPNGLSDSEEVFRFISSEISPEIHISLMSQYYPANKANDEILISRTLRPSEYEKAITMMEKYRLTNGWIQEMESSHYYRPEFSKNREKPFTN